MTSPNILNSRADLTLVTCGRHPGLPTDDAYLLEALSNLGLSFRIAAWDDQQVDWSASPLTMVRAAWDAHLHPAEFMAWLAARANETHLVNGAILAWNFDKTYLVALQAKDLATIPTVLLERAERGLVETALVELGVRDVVAKPRFGADAYGAARLHGVDVSADVTAHAQRFGTHGGLLLQPYVAAVARERERSLVFVAGRYSHSLYRQPFGRGPTRQTPDNRHRPSDVELEYCDRLFEAMDTPLAYARVDLVPFAGRPHLMELEAIDPSLFFAARPRAAELLAAHLSELDLTAAGVLDA